MANLCVYASQDAVQPIAIVVPHESKLRSAVSANPSTSSLASASIADLCSNKEVQKLVTNACNETGKKNKFKGAELLKGVVLTAEEWTPENGMVTAAQKVNRGAVGKKFREQIEEVYSH